MSVQNRLNLFSSKLNYIGCTALNQLNGDTMIILNSQTDKAQVTCRFSLPWPTLPSVGTELTSIVIIYKIIYFILT
jgi:hypothetical protein